MNSLLKILIFSLGLVLPAATYAQQAAGDDMRQLRSEHFIIHYDKAVEDGYVRKVRDKAETFYRRITQEFNLVRDKLWLWQNRAKIFVAKDRSDYLSKFSCPAWSGACVNYQDKIIYTFPNQDSFDSILAHELTHIIFREYVGQQHLPLWLDEGIAIYIEAKHGARGSEGMLFAARQAIKSDQYIKLDQLTQVTGRVLNSQPDDYVSLFYAQSFSVVHFLTKRYGRDSFNYFLFFLKNGNSFSEALRRGFSAVRTIEDLEKKWKRFYQE